MHGLFLTLFAATAIAITATACALYRQFENRLGEEIRSLEQKHLHKHCEKETES
jgi:hypothetical protein